MANPHYPRPPQKGPIVIPNASEVQFIWSAAGQKISFGIGGNLTAVGPLNPTVAESIFSAVKASAATTAYMAFVHPNFAFTGVTVKDLRAANNPKLFSTGTQMLGTSTGAMPSQASALVVTLTTQFSGRGFFGRIYLPGITVDNYADTRHYVTTHDTQILNFVLALNTAMTAQGMPWVLLHRQLVANTDPNAPPSQQQPRNAGVVPITGPKLADHRIDSQRRRLGR